MPERAINPKSATGCLLVLIPAALTMSALFVAWPVILGVTVLIAGGNIWQSYEWSKTVRSIDPVFQQSIVQYRGEISPLDLAVKANISGNVAKRYLATKANEFGTGSRQHPDRGQVYYFVSLNTLGRLFDDSEAELPELMPAATPVVAFTYPSVPAQLATPDNIDAQSVPVEPTSASLTSTDTTAQIFTPAAPVVTGDPIVSLPVVAESTPTLAVDTVPVVTSEPISLKEAIAQSEPTIADTQELAKSSIASELKLPADAPAVTILQSDLAKRLDVHSSTIYKRRSEPNFTDWTRNRDPDGTGWGYLVETKEYYRVDT
jgi:hypothetical protein